MKQQLRMFMDKYEIGLTHHVSTIDTQGWNKLSETHDDTNGTTTYEYSKDGSSDSITLVIDDNINNTGL